MKPRGAVRGFLLLPRRRRGSRSRSIAPRAVRRRRGSRSPRDARNAPGRRAGAGRRASAPRPRAPRRGIKARADRESASIARGGGSGRVPRAPRSFSPGNHLLLAHSLHRHGALDCCRVGNRGTAVSPRSRVAREARDIERGSRFDRLRSPSSRSRRADEIVGFTGAMGLALARTGKRGAAGGDLARGHLDGGSDGEVGGDDGGHFCCCVVCVKRGVCASMTRGPRSRGVLFERR
jgi:hypothetical protein